MDALNINTLHLRSHAEGICRDHSSREFREMACAHSYETMMRFDDTIAERLYAYSLDILCLMALTEALGLEYGGFA